MLQFRSPGARPRRAPVAFVCIALHAAVAGAEAQRYRFDNGIVARIHGPAEILANLCQRRGGETYFVPKPGIRYRFVTEVDDPVISNRGDGAFHPMPVAEVAAALRAIRLVGAHLDVDIYVLPYPRREVVDSSARDGMILLSPGVRPVSEQAVHFTVTHEVGHVFQYRWLPDADADGWDAYARTRGIHDGSVYRPQAAHRNRPHEIFAEDFRFLFGGVLSNYSGSIENEDLALPNTVQGLEVFLRDLPQRRLLPPAQITALPNPFLPSTAIQIRFHNQPSAPARVAVFDASGREIKQLFEGMPAGQDLDLDWDGRGDDGARVASGIYFARLDHRSRSITTKLVLLD
jgi:hypothetical protein